MKRWTSTWAALVVAGFLAMPAAGNAQTSTTPAPMGTSSTVATQKSAAGTPQEHLQQANAALSSVSSSAVPAAAQSQIAELKRHLSALEQAAGAPGKTPSAGASEKAGRSAAPWATEVAAADKIFASLLVDSRTTGTAGAASTNAPRPTGTSGTSKSASAVALDDETKAKLTSARASLTAFAAAMSGASSSPRSPDASASAAPAAHAVEPSATAAPTASPSAPTAAAPAPASPANPTPDPSAPSPAAPVTPAPDPSMQPQSAPPTSQSAGVEQTAGKTEAGGQAAVDEQAAKRSLTGARDTLSQLTQLPAASQLTGESRTQVSQLIFNFNELITATTGWRASYAKVDANLTALLGPDTGAEPAAAPAAPATGTAGAVGTSGTAATNIDPEVKAKLIELRKNLKAFEQAAGASAPK